MASAKRNRPVRFDQFKKQLAEAGVDELEEVSLSDTDSIFIRLGVNLGGDPDEFEDFMAGVRAAGDSEEICKIILGFYPDRSAEEQYQTFRDAGGEAHELVALFMASTQSRQERLGKLRTRRS